MKDILNPYIAGAPVVETSMFFGREAVFNWIERSLAGKYVDHILVLHGQRRVGKTSVLKQIPNFLSGKYIQVFFDLQGRTNTSLDRFMWWLAREIVRTLKQELAISIPQPDRADFTEGSEYLVNEFLPSLRPLLADQVLLLTFDEFDTLDRSEIHDSLAVPLINYLRRLMEIDWLNFIFSIGSSGDKLENMQSSYTDFFKSALYRKISFLTREDCNRLITKPVEGVIEYERKAVDRIARVTSGHPYFTQLMCHELFSLCQKTGLRTVKPEDVDAVLDDVIERGTVNLKFVWDEASDLEKWILAGLAQMEDGTTPNMLGQLLDQQRVRFSDSDLNSAIIHLRDKDVITQDNRFIIHLMRLWLLANRSLDRVREELVEVSPIANRYIEIGDEYRDLGQVQEALVSYQQALNVDPDHLKAQSSIASVHLETNSFQEAAEAFSLAIQIDDEDVGSKSGYCDANLALGDQARALDQIDQAIEYYLKILVINPAHIDARGQLAGIHLEQAEAFLSADQDDEALSAFNQALEFTPEDEGLAARYDQVLAQKKTKVIAEWLGKADKALGRQQWDEAAVMIDEALKLDPDSDDLQAKRLQIKDAPRQLKLQTYKRQAEQAITRGNFEKAIITLETAVQLAPEDATLAEWLDSTRSDQLNARLKIYRDQAQRAIEAGDWETAIQARIAAIKVSPDDPVLHRELDDTETAKHQAQLTTLTSQAQNAIQAGNWDTAIQAWKDAATLAPDDPFWGTQLKGTQAAKLSAQLDAFQTQSEEAISLGDWDAAINAIQSAIALEPEDDYWAEKLADIEIARHQSRLDVLRSEADQFRTAGKWDKAIAALEKHLELEPGDAHIQIEIAAFREGKRQSHLATFKTQANNATAGEEWDAAVQAWESYLAFEPEDHSEVKEKIQYAEKYARIARDYTDAQGAIRKKRYGRAIELLQGIVAQDPTYHSTSRLLVEAVEANTAIPLWRRSWLYWAVGALVVVMLGVTAGPFLWDLISTAEKQFPSVGEVIPEAEDQPSPTAPPHPAQVFTKPVLAYIASTAPDFFEDFSAPQEYWKHQYFFDGSEFPLSDMVSEGALRLVDDEYNRGFDFRENVISGENFVLQFDFMSDGTARGTQVYLNIRGSQTDRFYRFSLQMNGYWKLEEDGQGVVEGEGPIQEGNIELKSNRFYTLKLFAVDDQIAICLDGEVIAHFEDSNLTGQENMIGVSTAYSYNELQIDIDNIKFWNLEEVETQSDGPNTYQQAIDFADPILASVAEHQPTYEEDFSTEQDYWGERIFHTHPFGQPEQGTDVPLSDLILDGVMRIQDEPAEELIYEPGGINEFLGAEDFVLQFGFTPHDFRYGSNYFLGFRGGVNQTYGLEMSVTESGNWNWILGVHDERGRTSLASGSTNLNIDQSNQIQLVVKGSQIAFFKNGQPLTYLEDDTGTGYRTNMWFSSFKPIDVEIDNIKFWDLDEVDISAEPSTPKTLFSGTIRDYLDTSPPTFEDDFSTTKSEWGSFYNGYNKDAGNADLTQNEFEQSINDVVSDGVLHASGTNRGVSLLPQNNLLEASNFALEINFDKLTQLVHKDGYFGFRFRATNDGSSYYEFQSAGEINIYWEISKVNGGYTSLAEGVTSAPNTKLLYLAYEDTYTIYLNDQMIHTFQDSDIQGNQNHIIFGGDPDYRIDIDTVKFWNLDGADVGEVEGPAEEPTPAPATGSPTISDLILTYLESETPTFEDDFSATDRFIWGYTSELIPIYERLVYGGKLNVTDHTEQPGGGVPNDHAVPGVTFPTNGLFKAENFALQFDFSFYIYNPVKEIGVKFRYPYNQKIGYEINISRYSTWTLTQNDGTISISNGQWSLKNGLNSLLLIVKDQNLAIFLNDELLYISNDLDYFGSFTEITVLGTNGSGGLFDNVKFWNLEGADVGEVESPAEEPTPAPAAGSPTISDLILAYMESETPTFEDDFSTDINQWEWGNNSEGYRIDGMRQGDLLLINYEMGESARNKYDLLGFSFPTNGLFNARDFAFQFDFDFDGWGWIGARFRSTAAQNIHYQIIVSPSGEWQLVQEPGGLLISEGSGPISNDFYTLLVIVQNGNLAIYLEGELIYETDDLMLVGESNRIIAERISYGAIGKFDNVKFWDLDGVEFDQQTDTATEPDLASLHYKRQITEQTITDLALSVNPDYPETMDSIAVAGDDRQVIVVQSKSGITSYSSLDPNISAVSWKTSGSGDLSMGDEDGIVKIVGNPFNPTGTTTQLDELSGKGAITALLYLDWFNLAAGTTKGTVAIWSVKSHDWTNFIDLLQPATGNIFEFDKKPKSSQFLIVSESDGVQVWDTEGWSWVMTLDYPSYSASWSPDGRFIALEDHTSETSNLVILKFGVEQTSVALQTIINQLAWSPDGKMIATAGIDGVIRIWNGINENGEITSLNHLLSLTQDAEITTIVWSPDGSTIITGDVNGFLWSWSLPKLDI